MPTTSPARTRSLVDGATAFPLTAVIFAAEAFGPSGLGDLDALVVILGTAYPDERGLLDVAAIWVACTLRASK